MSNPCLIVDVTLVTDWEPSRGGKLMPISKRPTLIQPSLAQAEDEAKRLACAHPGHSFAIFEASLLAMTVSAPTHVTLSGQVVATAVVPRLVRIEDDLIPF